MESSEGARATILVALELPFGTGGKGSERVHSPTIRIESVTTFAHNKNSLAHLCVCDTKISEF